MKRGTYASMPTDEALAQDEEDNNNNDYDDDYDFKPPSRTRTSFLATDNDNDNEDEFESNPTLFDTLPLESSNSAPSYNGIPKQKQKQKRVVLSEMEFVDRLREHQSSTPRLVPRFILIVVGFVIFVGTALYMNVSLGAAGSGSIAAGSAAGNAAGSAAATNTNNANYGDNNDGSHNDNDNIMS